MDLQLAGKTALVTGASSVGIGRVIAAVLAEEGVRVAISARRKPLLEEVAQQIASRGGPEPVVLPADLYEPGAPVELARAALERLGRVDILVNAAGGSRPTSLDAPASLWEEAMLLNFLRLRELTVLTQSSQRPLGAGPQSSAHWYKLATRSACPQRPSPCGE